MPSLSAAFTGVALRDLSGDPTRQATVRPPRPDGNEPHDGVGWLQGGHRVAWEPVAEWHI